MFSYELRKDAIETFIRLDCNYEATFSELGYPSRYALWKWWREYLETGEIPAGKAARSPKYPEDARLKAVEYKE